MNNPSIEIRQEAKSLATGDFRPLLRELLDNPLPPRIMRFVKQVGKGINSLDMIGDGDRVMLAISAGKDSLALSLALALRRKWLPIKYRLEAVQILWREYPLTEAQKTDLHDYFDMLDVPFKMIEASMFAPDTKGKRFSCYICSRNRKRILFNDAEERGFNKIALGHHIDDIVQTTLMNMVLHGNLTAMMPVQDFFDGKLQIIRPMCECREKQIIAITQSLQLPVVSIGCPYRDESKRMEIKPIIESLETYQPGAKENMYKSLFNVKADYIPGLVYKGIGVRD